MVCSHWAFAKAKETPLIDWTGRGKGMVVVVDRVAGGSKVRLRAFCCKARGGGGRLRQATRVKGEREVARQRGYAYPLPSIEYERLDL